MIFGRFIDNYQCSLHFIFPRDDLLDVLARTGQSVSEIDYLTAAAIGMAREMGDQMLSRRPLDPDGAASFATRLLMDGLNALMPGESKESTR